MKVSEMSHLSQIWDKRDKWDKSQIGSAGQTDTG